MSRQLSFDPSSDELKHVVPLDHWIRDSLLSFASPFKTIPIALRLLIATSTYVVQVLKRILGKTLYLENTERELSALEPRARALLLVLLKKGLATAWYRTWEAPDVPPVAHCLIRISDAHTKGGVRLSVQGNHGEGVGKTFNDALIPALAETFERHALAHWSHREFMLGTYDQLRKKGAVPLSVFRYHSQSQINSPAFKAYSIQDDSQFRWTSARSLVDGSSCLIPAQLVYFNFWRVFPDEPRILLPNSNGAAAAQSYEKAAVRGVSELIERDALMTAWLNKTRPPRLDMSTVPDESVRTLASRFNAYRFDLHILDITTDLSVPSFCAVLVDRFGKRAVSMSAAAGFDPIETLRKLLFEISKFPHFSDVSDTSTPLSTFLEHPERLVSFSARRNLWAQRSMLEHIEPFISDPLVSFEGRAGAWGKAASCRTTEDKLEFIQTVFKNNGYDCYVVDITSDLARRYGLHIVKAISPSLVPVYFDESKKPLGVRRIYETPMRMGYRSHPSHEDELNNIPHPFL
jgi:ribosomal protein S12 methylthiotransferase accessory factor